MSNLLKISIEKLLERTDNDITDVTQSITDAYSLAGGLDASDVKDAILLNLAHAFTVLSDWQKYYHHFNEIVVNINNNSDELIDTNAKLAKKVEEQYVLISQLQNKLSVANELINLKNNSSNMVQVDIVALVESLERTLNTIESNAKVITQAKKVKLKGELAPAFNNDVHTEDIIKAYQLGETPNQIAQKCGMTQSAIIYRLKQAGVYIGRGKPGRPEK